MSEVTDGIWSPVFSHNYYVFTHCLVKILIRLHVYCGIFIMAPQGQHFAVNLTLTLPANMIKSLLLPSLHILTYFS